MYVCIAAFISLFVQKHFCKCTKGHKIQKTIKILLFTIQPMQCMQALLLFQCSWVLLLLFFLRVWFLYLLLVACFVFHIFVVHSHRLRRILFFIACDVSKVIINKAHSRVRNKSKKTLKQQQMQKCIANWNEIQKYACTKNTKLKHFPRFFQSISHTFYDQRLIIQFFILFSFIIIASRYMRFMFFSLSLFLSAIHLTHHFCTTCHSGFFFGSFELLTQFVRFFCGASFALKSRTRKWFLNA